MADFRRPPDSHGPSDSRRPSIMPDSRRPSTRPDSRRPSTRPDPRRPSTTPDPGRPSTRPDPRRPSTTPDSRRPSTMPDPRRPSTMPDPRRPSILSDPRRPSVKPDALRSSRAGSLAPPVSILQSNTLNLPDPLQDKGSELSSVHYADQEAQSPSGKDKDKQSNAGTRLLNMLRKTLKGSQSEEMVVTQDTPTLIPFGDVVGCLAVHIKSCRQFSRRLSLQQYTNLFIRMSINHIVKRTKIHSLKSGSNEKNHVIKFDEVKYFSVQVPRRQDDDRNNIFLELMQDGDTEKHPFFLGSVEVHLYEVIQKGCFTEVLQMMHRNTYICRLEVEFMFSYGNFGYGFSHQLKPLQKIVEPSMFMNIAPPPERTDPLTKVITPQRVDHPAFLPSDLNVSIGTAVKRHSKEPSVVKLEKLQEKPRERLEKMKKEYRNLSTWIEKADYLRSIINPKVDYKDSKESNIDDVSENQNSSIYEEEPEILTVDVPLRRPETTSSEFLDNGNKEGLVIPILKLSDEDTSVPAVYRSGESAPIDLPLPPIHALKIVEEDEAPHLYRTDSEADKEEKGKSVAFPSEEKLIPKHSSILKIASSLQEVKRKKDRSPHFSDVLIIPDKPLVYENTNKKEKPPNLLKKSWEGHPTDIASSIRKVAFAQQEYIPPVFRAESAEFKPKHQKFSKGGLDPFLRSINSKMSFRKKKDQDLYKCPNILSTELLEHEDQDPPYPTHLKSSGHTNIDWADDPNFITLQMLNHKNKLSPDPSITTTKTSDSKNKLPSDNPTIIITQISDTDTVSSDPSVITTKTSDSRNKMSRDPFVITTKTSDSRNKVSRDPSVITTKTSDSRNKVSRDPSVTTTKTSDSKNKVSRDPSFTTKASDSKNKVSRDPSFTTKSSDTKNKLSRDPCIKKPKTSDTKNFVLNPDIFTTETSDVQYKLEERLLNLSLPNFKRESSMTGNVNIYHPSKSLNFTSDIENLKQSMLLKSILSKNLQDLSDKLFSEPEVCTNIEPIQKSSLLGSIQDWSSSSMEDKLFEKVQDISSWLSAEDILTSQSLLSPVIKSIPADSLREGKQGKSSEVDVPEHHSETDEKDFPMNKKSSFKTKHLVSEVSSSKLGLNGSICDYSIKQIFTAPLFSQLGTGVKALSEAQMAAQDQLLTPWERNESSHILNDGETDHDLQLSQPKSVISQIIQSFPIDTLLESGIIKVIELDNEYQSTLLGTQTTSPKEELKNYSEEQSHVKSETELLSRQNTPITPYPNTSEYEENSQNMFLQEAKSSIPYEKSDLPNATKSLDTEENDLTSTLESLSNSLGKLNESDTTMLKSFLKNIFNIFFKFNQSQRRHQPEKELERLIQHSLSNGREHFEKIQGNFNKADKVQRKAILSPKLRVFLEELSESEVKNLKSELSKNIQHYLVERLSESGHITKEDLPKIYQNLYLMNEKAELKEQNTFKEKYSETVKEIMSFVNNFNHHFIDKHLEIKLRSFLNEILQNYFLKNLSVSSLFNETEAVTIHSNISSLRSQRDRVSLHGLGQDISRGSFGRKLEISMKYPLNKSLQNYLRALSENELLNLKADLSKYLQILFIEKLAKSGLMTEGQVKGINQQMNLLHSTSIPLKNIKTHLSFRDENYFMKEDSEEQKKCLKIAQNTTLQKVPKDNHGETELTRKEEKGYSFLQNLKEDPSTIEEQKNDYTKEGKTLNLIKVQSSNKNIQAFPLNKSSEKPAELLFKKHRKDRGFMQLPQAENYVYKTEIQDPYHWDGKSKTIQSKRCFEKTIKMKPVDKRENVKLIVQEKPEGGLSPYPKILSCKMPRENECLNRLPFPNWQTNTFIHVNPESGEKSKLDQYCQRSKGNNNNNKKHLVTFAQFKNEMETLYINPYEVCNEKSAKISESQSFKYKEHEKNSRPSFFPEVLKRENMKLKKKERDHAVNSKSFHKIVRILPTTLPTTRTHLKKSVPRSLLHWTARRTIHDCLDRFEDLHAPSVKYPKKSKSRARLLGKSPDDTHNQAKHCVRPYTAPEPNKRRESATGKFASPRMVSAGLVHLCDTIPDYEIRKMKPKRKLKEDIEKHPLIWDIIQMLDNAE